MLLHWILTFASAFGALYGGLKQDDAIFYGCLTALAILVIGLLDSSTRSPRVHRRRSPRR